MSAPRVSVVIPTYNRARMVCEAIDSVLAQTMADFELIVVDDGSTDGTMDLLEARYGEDPRVRPIRQENRGCHEARQTGLEHARAPYLSTLDSDDLYLPRFLESQSRFLDTHPDTDLVVCDARMETPQGVHIPSLFGHEGWIAPTSFASFGLGGWFWPSTMMMRTAVARDVGFRSAFPAAEDRDLLCRLLAADHTVRLNEELLTVYRSHDVGDSAPQATRARVATATDQLRVSRRYAHLTPRPRRILGRAHKRLALALIDEGRWREARQHLRCWWRNKPDSVRALRLLARSYFVRA